MAMAAIVAGQVEGQVTSVPAPAAETGARVPPTLGEMVLSRRISLHLHHVTLADALTAIAEQSRITLLYSREEVPLSKIVSIDADDASIAAALRTVLAGTSIKLYPSSAGRVALEARAVGAATIRLVEQGGGAIAGRVTDAKTGQGLPDVTVTVEVTNYRAVTAGDGRYVVRGVPPASYRVTARVLSYSPLTKAVTVMADSSTLVDFALVPAAASLEQVVVTGAGPQRRVEVGNAIATLNVDTVVRTAAVTNITDVLSGRIPNVDVVQTSGLVGAGPAVRIRGRGSVNLSNDPIYIVDGVRVDGSPGGLIDPFQNGGTMPSESPLNEISPDEIETIEVLRGPSAATEYGTDAANGVVVITTKRGHVSSPRLSVTAEQGVITMPIHFPDNYYSWGHTTGAPPVSTMCPLVPFTLFGPPGTPGSSAGQCIVDSVTRWQPLNHSSTSLFGTGNRGHYGVQVSGGGAEMQYLLAGGLTNDVGALRMPPTEVTRLERERGQTLPDDQLRPNALNDADARGRVTTTVGHITDLSASVAYVKSTQRAPDENQLLLSALTGSGIRDTLSGYSGIGGFPPGTVLSTTGSQGVSRLTGGLSGTWRPMTWLDARVTVGLDGASRTHEVFSPPGEGAPVCGDPTCATFGQLGYRLVGSYRTDIYTVDMSVVATTPLSRLIIAKTAVGAQYYSQRASGSAVAVVNLGLGNATLNGGTVFNQLEQNLSAKTLGSYVEETIGLADRLFLVGALREDAGSGFGTAYKAAAYPKASASWVISQQSGHLLRLRAAYGQSGVQPPAGSALQLYVPTQTYYGTGSVPGVQLSTRGSPGLRPERTAELETGADLGLFGDRLTAEVTGYAKLSRDALVSVPLEGSLGGGSQLLNLGKVSNRGIEASVAARLLDARWLQWDLTVGGSYNQNKLVTLGPGVSPIDQTNVFEGPYKQQPGYPLYGLWAYRTHYRDANHDGIIEPNEVRLDSSASFIGPSLAPRQLSVSTGVTVLRGCVHMGAQLDSRSGQYLTNTMAGFSNLSQWSRATNDPHAPLAEQARAVATLTDPLFHVESGYVESASFVRFRELSVTYNVPNRLAEGLRARALSVTVAARNLALWSKYTGSDPEVSTVQGGNFVRGPGGVLTTAVNPDIVGDFGSVPQMRYWTLKVNLGL